jgi:hypothetical protein
VVGVVLVVAMIVIGSTVVVALGGQALRDTEDRSDVERAQQAMTLFDSGIEGVALGESDRRTVNLGRTSGRYRVDPTAGEISIINVDRDDDGTNDDGDIDPNTGGSDNDDEYILAPTTLGAVVYEGAEHTVAYQGGGVWQRGPDGAATMVSPPEFHYRGRTPMLPVVQVVGGGTAGGSASVTVSKGAYRARNVYPNASRSFANGDPFENPVHNGSVIVRIESAYADAWATYFEERTDGNVTRRAPGVVTVELVPPGRDGEFDMPLEGGGITVDGASGGHGIERTDAGKTAFSIRLRPDDPDGAKFSNLQWSLYADEGDQEFEIHLEKAGSTDSCADGSTSTAAHVTVYYSWNGGEDYHGWRTTTPVEAKCANLDPSDAEEEIYLEITFVDDDGDGVYDDDEGADDVQLEFGSLSTDDLERFGVRGTLNGSYPLEGHSAAGEPVSPVAGSTTRSSDQLVNHYFAELPAGFALRVDDRSSNTVDEDASTVTFYAAGGGEHATYLHATATKVEVELKDD